MNMMKLQLLLVLLLAGGALMAQRSLTVYTDAADKKPFYLRMGSKVTTSGTEAQVSLKNLSGSVYEIILGIPSEDSAEYKFQISLKKEDNSFRLHKSNAIWSLADAQTDQVLTGVALSTAKNKNTTVAVKDDPGTGKSTGAGNSADQFTGMIRKTDAFSVMMAGVVNDTAVLYTMPVVIAPKVDVAVAQTSTQKNDAGTFGIQEKEGTKPIDSALAAAERKENENQPLNADSAVQNLPVSVATKEDNPAKLIDSMKRSSEKETTVVADSAVKSAINDDIAELIAEEKKEIAAVKKTDSGVVMKTKPDVPLVKDTPAKKTSGISFRNAVSGVQKLFEKKTDKEVILDYSDKSADGKTDTIRITIPVEKDTAGSPASSVKPAPDTNGAGSTTKKQSSFGSWNSNPRPLTDKTEAGKSEVVKTETSKPDEQKSEALKTSGAKMVNSDCNDFALDADVDKLKIRMSAEKGVEDQIAAAKRVFKTKCFTTKQVRVLSGFFTTDDSRYKFLDASYPFVSDSGEFKTLVDLLKEDYYIKRFSAMIRS
ncbi:MAG: DUF4476 domain-containing protein [Chitinophagaceae bacterium]|nr:MAG: DUF4476 domain-containing protein [Chitinophagaceae bacterium]